MARMASRGRGRSPGPALRNDARPGAGGDTSAVDDYPEASRLRRRTLWFGWSAVTFGLLVVALVVTVCVVLYLRYERGLGG